jgi:hypothetical protein
VAIIWSGWSDRNGAELGPAYGGYDEDRTGVVGRGPKCSAGMMIVWPVPGSVACQRIRRQASSLAQWILQGTPEQAVDN